MLDTVARQRCFNHAHREAAARCPQCHRHFCRECVTEHQGRLLCSSCLAELTTEKVESKPLAHRVWSLLRLTAAFLVVWACFAVMGKILTHVPSDFHGHQENASESGF